MFLAPWFALAGLVVAAGPIVIHLLNRQRYRVVEWAAMDFLRQAVRRSRRILRLRDLLLLALRTLCVLLFALAMARPYFVASSAQLDPDQPVHAVLVVDNSLSMAYEQVEGTVLDEAKARAKAFCGRLPPGSCISILPLCGSATEFNRDAYHTRDDALEALDAIEPADRSASAAAAIDLALEACRRVNSHTAKQVVFISDQQLANWPATSLSPQLEQLPGTLQVVQVAADEVENAWGADFQLQDNIADLSSPAVFLATISYQGSSPRHDVQVTLAVDGITVAARSISLEPGQSREVRFPPYQFDVPVEPGRPTFVTAEVSIPQDRLPADDHRVLVAPVVSALPIVFVDQFGDDEDPDRNRIGETFRLRRLLTPVTSRTEQERQLVEVRHVKAEQLDRDLLEDARLVVIAGLADPPDAVPLLREYVEQGGFLVIAAGADFDPASWTPDARTSGLGILPAPLKPKPVGRLPGASAGRLEPFQLDFTSMLHEYFLLEQTSTEELADLYSLPYFFKAVEADLSEEVLDEMARAATVKIDKARSRLPEVQQRLDELAEKEVRTQLSEAERQERERMEQARADLRPQWLLWEPPHRARGTDTMPVAPDDSFSADQAARASRPRVLAAFTNRVPFMIQRDIGRGQVLFVSTGVYRDWNTLTSTNAVLIFDRIFRDMLGRTLPRRNITSSERLVLPVPADYRRARFTISGPDRDDEPISVEALGADREGIRVDNLTRRGHYRITAHATGEMPQAALGARLWDIPLAVNGPADESQLDVLDRDGLAERMGQSPYRWVDRQETISLAGSPIHGRDLWKWLMLSVLLGLVVELAILARPCHRWDISDAPANGRARERAG